MATLRQTVKEFPGGREGGVFFLCKRELCENFFRVSLMSLCVFNFKFKFLCISYAEYCSRCVSVIFFLFLCFLVCSKTNKYPDNVFILFSLTKKGGTKRGGGGGGGGVSIVH